MAKEKKEFEFKQLTKPKEKEKKEALEEIQEDEIVLVSGKILHSLREKMNDFCFWNGLTQDEVISSALEAFFKGKDIQPRPEAVKKKQSRVGRKRKHN